MSSTDSGGASAVELRRYDSEEVAVLVEELQGEYVTRYGGRDETPRLVLETGAKQPEALASYESSGYPPTPSFGFHRDSPRSRSLAKDLIRS